MYIKGQGQLIGGGDGENFYVADLVGDTATMLEGDVNFALQMAKRSGNKFLEQALMNGLMDRIASKRGQAGGVDELTAGSVSRLLTASRTMKVNRRR